MFPYYRMCSLTVDLLEGNAAHRWDCYRMCSLPVEYVPLLQNMFPYYRMCSLTRECVPFL